VLGAEARALSPQLTCFSSWPFRRRHVGDAECGGDDRNLVRAHTLAVHRHTREQCSNCVLRAVPGHRYLGDVQTLADALSVNKATLAPLKDGEYDRGLELCGAACPVEISG
jgi:hypothetical protein